MPPGSKIGTSRPSSSAWVTMRASRLANPTITSESGLASLILASCTRKSVSAETNDSLATGTIALLLQPVDHQVGHAVAVGAGEVDDAGPGVSRLQQFVGDGEGVGGERRGHHEDRLGVLGRLQDLGRRGVGRQEGERLPAGGGGHGHGDVGDAGADEHHHVLVVDDRAHVVGPVGGDAGVVELLEDDGGPLQGPVGDAPGVVDLGRGQLGAVADVVAGGLRPARERAAQGDGDGLGLVPSAGGRGRVVRVVAAGAGHQGQGHRQGRCCQPPPLHRGMSFHCRSGLA